MKIFLPAVFCILSFKICKGAVVPDKGMKMDQLIMAAAKSHDEFDFTHLMNDEPYFMYQLDILMGMGEFYLYLQSRYDQRRRKRKATLKKEDLWPNSTVYYDYNHANGKLSQKDVAVIKEAIAEWENYTCLKFNQSSEQKDRVVFQNGGGCSSRLGRRGGPQPINLGPGCRTKGVVIHEIGHAIGWIHEHSRPDRDEFITVDFTKIPSPMERQYEKVDKSRIDDRDVMYDYDSIMHYSGKVFGQGTIVTHDRAAQNRIGQTEGLSFRDIKLASLMYQCAEKMNCSTEPCPGEGFRQSNCKCVCPGPIGNPLVPCDNTTSVIPTKPPKPIGPTESPTTPGRDCMDMRSNCAALKAKGSCLDDLARMSIFCRETCELCNEETTCMNYDEACPFFASNGYCERDEIGMFFKDECPLSCGVCDPPDDTCQAYLQDQSSSSRNGASFVVTSLVIFATMYCI